MKHAVWIPLLVLASGCGLSSSKVVAPPVDPAEAASRAMEEYDTNSDGKIDKTEAKQTVLDAKAGWDADGDGSISEDEIRERLERYEALKPGIQSMTCTVLWRNRPLENAEVVFEPEAFLGESVEMANGTTDENGIAELVAEEVAKEDPTLRGIRAALYKVRITHPDLDIPARYNTETTLFFELGPMDMVLPPTFRMK